MSIERLLQLHTAALAVMGAAFLGLGQNNAVMPIVLTVAAVIAMSLGNVWSWLKINRIVANVAALGAVAWSLRDFLDRDTEGQLLAIADMLVYLQIVLLFQEKTARVFWQLLVLSLLQVVVAAALNLGLQFAVLLAVYIAVALSALLLLSVYREFQPLPPAKSLPAEPAAPWQHLLQSPSVALDRQQIEQRVFLRSPKLVIGQVLILGLATLLFTAVFFFSSPRQSENMWIGPRSRFAAKTGFSPEVSLKREGSMQPSNELVMRVALTRLADQHPYILLGDPYFNGIVLTDYLPSGTSGRWIASQMGRHGFDSQSIWTPLLTPRTMLIRQDYVLESPSTPALFAILPFHKLTTTSDSLRYARHAQRLMRGANDDYVMQGEFRYTIGTFGLRDGRQLHVVPHPNPLVSFEDHALLEMELTRLRQFEEARFPQLKQIAARVLREAGVEGATSLEKGLALQDHFTKAGNYTYTLNQNFPHDINLDPVEDFVANHKRGHCEYFASALAMMLRSQGIPSRLVIGYKGGEFNSLGHYYQVQQRHTHAWVEAYLPAEEVPESEIACTPSDGGGWYRLDPTPTQMVSLESSASDSLFNRAGEAIDYLDLLWRDYILGLNSTRQRDKLYDPITSQAASRIPPWLDPDRAQASMRGVSDRFRLSKRGRGGQRGPAWSWPLALMLTGIGLTTVGAIRGLWWLSGRRQRKRKRAGLHSVRGYQAAPPFYLRLERILARANLRRAKGQTARELAAAAAVRLAAAGDEAAESKSLPDEVVAAYYRVRFGGATLDSQESASVEQALAKLTVVTRKKPG